MMTVIRAPKGEDFNKYFNDLTRSGLFDYPSPEYKTWNWQYRENPFNPDKNPHTWIYSLDEKAVGHLGAIPVELKVGLRKIRAAWAVDFMALAAYKRRGIGRSLVEEANKCYDLFLAVGATDASFALFTKLGWEFLGCLPYYIKVFDLQALIKKKIKNIVIANCIFIPVNFLLKAYNCFRQPSPLESIEVERIDNFTEEADIFWGEIAGYYMVTIPRNKDYLNWRYDRRPDMRYVKFRAADGENLRGYVVVRCNKSKFLKPEGLIADIIARPDDKDALIRLVSAASSYLKNQGCSIVRCYASHKGIQDVLAKCGLIKRRSQMRFLVKKNIETLKEVDNLDNWHITAGDSDIDRKVN